MDVPEVAVHLSRGVSGGGEGQDGHVRAVLGQQTGGGAGLGEDDDHGGVEVDGGFHG